MAGTCEQHAIAFRDLERRVENVEEVASDTRVRAGVLELEVAKIKIERDTSAQIKSSGIKAVHVVAVLVLTVAGLVTNILVAVFK